MAPEKLPAKPKRENLPLDPQKDAQDVLQLMEAIRKAKTRAEIVQLRKQLAEIKAAYAEAAAAREDA